MANLPVTPAVRIVPGPKGDPREQALHRRVKAMVDGTGDRCIIENKPGVVGVDLCHVFGRAKSAQDTLMTSIEYQWGHSTRYTLNVDSKSNCFYAIKNLHTLFDKGKWILLPCLETLETYAKVFRLRLSARASKAAARARLAEDEDRRHRYTFVPLHPDMDNLAIQWQKKDKPLSANDYEIIPFPFTNRIIDSHIHPKFVILCAGLHLKNYADSKHKLTMDPHLKIYQERIDLVTKLYSAWSTPLSEMDYEDTWFHSERPPSQRTIRKLAAKDPTYSGVKPKMPPSRSLTGSRWSARLDLDRQDTQSQITTMTAPVRLDDNEALAEFRQTSGTRIFTLPLDQVIDMQDFPESPTRQSVARSFAALSENGNGKKRKLDEWSIGGL